MPKKPAKNNAATSTKLVENSTNKTPEEQLNVKALALKKHKLYKFIEWNLTTHRYYLSLFPIKCSPLTQSELYWRSATTEQIHGYLSLIKHKKASSILVVASGFKHQQLACDRNPYGDIRIFSPVVATREALYTAIKLGNQPVLSKESHRARHTMKFFDATLSNKKILSEPIKIVDNDDHISPNNMN